MFCDVNKILSGNQLFQLVIGIVMIKAKMIPETSVFSNHQLTLLITQEDFIEVYRRERFRSYVLFIYLSVTSSSLIYDCYVIFLHLCIL